MKELQTLGARIKAQREQTGKTLQQIAEEIHVAKSTVQRYERDTIAAPKQPVVAAIAKSLNVSTAWLLCQTEDKFPLGAGDSGDDLEFKYALFDEAAPLTPENRKKLLEMAQFFKQQQEKES
ncbi:MAG: helix-turn-helix transcriptional regulator [Ruthenibacterium sp.]